MDNGKKLLASDRENQILWIFSFKADRSLGYYNKFRKGYQTPILPTDTYAFATCSDEVGDVNGDGMIDISLS